MTAPAGESGPLGVLWDMDGTLVDSEKLWDVSLAGLAMHLGGVLSAPARASMVGSSLCRTIRLMFHDLRLPADPEAMAGAGEWLTRRTEQLFRSGLPWRPGAPEALRMVRAAGWATALVTSTHRGLVDVALESIGPRFFDVVVCGDEVPATKPAPDPYLMAATKVGLPPGLCVAIEDSPAGVRSAEAAGCAVLVVPSEVPVPPGPRRVRRAGLVGLTPGELRSVWAGNRPPDR
jgi:HAD superfamily hydrolase (TIGR01509 family)